VKRYKVRFTAHAEEDLVRLYEFLFDRDVDATERALPAIHAAAELLHFSPFEPGNLVNVLAVRHQREEDYR
jgi:plasmid stabilization system protein ParE